METIRFLFQLYLRPASAMSEIIDKGSWFSAAVLVLLVSGVFFFTVNAELQAAYHVPTLYEFYQPDAMLDEAAAEIEYNRAAAEYRRAFENRRKIPVVGDAFFNFFSFEPGGFYQPLLSISLFYVPLAVFLMCFVGGAGNFGVVLRRGYGEFSTCTLTAWAAAHLPFSVVGVVLYSQEAVSPLVFLGFWAASGLLFGVFMIFALRTVFGANYGTALLVVSIAWLGFSLGMYVFRFVSPWLFSPFLLFFAYLYFGGALAGGVGSLGDAFRQKQNFKRFLHNATVNPRDADAHVQLALIYLQRRQEAKAREHLTKAHEIDENEIDANFELGKIARSKGELQKALDHFAVVVGQNDKHALSEIWREVGATYMEAGMHEQAREALEKFVERRPVDSEGLYYLGKVLKATGDGERAREMFEQAIESARTSPDYRRRELRYWSKLAEKQLTTDN